MDYTDPEAASNQYRLWMKEAYELGYHPSYGSAKFIKKYGQRINNKIVARGAIFGNDPTWFDRRDYIEHLVKMVNSKGGQLSKAREYYKVEFNEEPEDAGFELNIVNGKLELDISSQPENNQSVEEPPEVW